MNDRHIMEGLLLEAKGVCDLYMHGAIESSTGSVRDAFSSALNETLAMGDSIYQEILDVAGGKPTKAELLGHDELFGIGRFERF